MKTARAESPEKGPEKDSVKVTGKGPVCHLGQRPNLLKTKGPHPNLTERQRLFCAALVSGNTAPEAYREAGYVGRDAAAASRVLMRRPQIAAHLNLLQQANQMPAGNPGPGSDGLLMGKVSERELIETLHLVMRKGLEKGTLPPVVSAASLFAKICGFDTPQDAAAAVAVTVPEIHIHFLQAEPRDKGDKNAETD